MATVLFQAAGSALGALLGPLGAALGSAAGALAGYAVDRSLIDSTRRIEGPRLASARPLSGEEGAPIPRLYGTARLGGIVIWATRFEEVATTRRQGGKGNGPKVTEYSYYANVAFALCEGEIAGVRRIWADGREIDQTGIQIRVHRGGEAQAPDPLIAARQGTGNAPAYRGLAYVVFERLPIADFGNRIPQIQFEVMRPVGRLRHSVRAVALIPGSTEHGLHPGLVTRERRPGETVAANRHVLHAGCDIEASLDELQAVCPNLEEVALVVSWFGDDLRVDHCAIRPGVTTGSDAGFSTGWVVSGMGRGSAAALSTHEGAPAYGGTPSDASVIAAIAAIRSRGLRVTLYPFVMMDVPAGNTRPDPYGADAQAAYPWRGRITCHPAPGEAGSPDGSAAVRSAVDAFCGAALVSDFTPGTGTVAFSGGGSGGYRRMILHYAHLAAMAGGVDGFLVGSELRGLTTLRDDTGSFPFVDALCTLAAEVKAVLGSSTAVTYAADWTEYFGYRPDDGSDDVYFHLDPLWAHEAIAAIGIDCYMPQSDWRDEDRLGANPEGAVGPYDPVALRAGVAGGEGFDWYYPTFDDRLARRRSVIEDGAYGKPWTFRYKDLVGWWSNTHVERRGGVEVEEATAWVPRSKPIWLTELGCPAIDKGPNQPNVFVDPKSSESFAPHFSDGGRSEVAQQRYLEAAYAHWDPDGADFDAAANPLSDLYGGRMVDRGRNFAWCWDARPFPAFPLRSDVWADGGNWQLGHWLNGRLEGAELGATVNAILADHGLPPADVRRADGAMAGYVIDEPMTARAALEPLTELFGLSAAAAPEGLVVRCAGQADVEVVTQDELVLEDEQSAIALVRLPDHDLPERAVLSFSDPLVDYQVGTTATTRLGTSGLRQRSLGFAGALHRDQGALLSGEWLDQAWAGRETVSFAVPAYRHCLTAGSLVALPGRTGAAYLVTEVEDGLLRRVKARRIDRTPARPGSSSLPAGQPPAGPAVGRPHVLFLDLPAKSSATAPAAQFRIAAWQKPWKSLVALASPESEGYEARATIDRPARLGALRYALTPGAVAGRIDRGSTIEVELFEAEVESVSRARLLGGSNAAAVRTADGVWEVLQFETAEELSPDVWRLSGLLRGQLGTDDAMRAGAPAGASFVVLDDRLVPAGLTSSEAGLALSWAVGPGGELLGADRFVMTSEAGGRRALTPLSAVHLRCRRRADGDVAIGWVRRGRVDADDWDAVEIPLGEEGETYRVDIAPPGGAVLRSITVTEPGWIYAAGDLAADFPSAGSTVEVTVRQLSARSGWGLPSTTRFIT
jgi:hypothetical protein